MPTTWSFQLKGVEIPNKLWMRSVPGGFPLGLGLPKLLCLWLVHAPMTILSRCKAIPRHACLNIVIWVSFSSHPGNGASIVIALLKDALASFINLYLGLRIVSCIQPFGEACFSHAVARCGVASLGQAVVDSFCDIGQPSWRLAHCESVHRACAATFRQRRRMGLRTALKVLVPRHC